MHKILVVLGGLLLATATHADWRVDAESSRVSFIATKNVHQTDVGRFFGLLGEVGPDGDVLLRVELDSLRTGVLLQDQRLRKELFDSARFAFAEVRARLDLQPILKLAPGAQMELTLPASLDLHGVGKPFRCDLLITRLDAHRFQIVTLSPVVLDAADFGLAEPLAGLRQSAGLKSVSLAVPVSAVLIFSER